MICRDRDLDTEEAGFQSRDYVLQNWRADVIALAASDGDLLERVTYDPYGIPFATHPTDLTFGATSGVSGYGMPNGTVNGDDYSYFLALYAATDWRADWNRDGTLSAADNTAFLADYGAASGSWGRGVLSNRSNILGYAGYVHEPATGSAGSGHGTMMHCRMRVHHAGFGRWIQRDPPQFEYGEGPSLYWYGAASPVVMVDWLGGPCVSSGCAAVVSTPPRRRIPVVGYPGYQGPRWIEQEPAQPSDPTRPGPGWPALPHDPDTCPKCACEEDYRICMDRATRDKDACHDACGIATAIAIAACIPLAPTVVGWGVCMATAFAVGTACVGYCEVTYTNDKSDCEADYQICMRRLSTTED